MSYPRINTVLLPALILSNFWIYKIFSLNFFIGVFLCLLSVIVGLDWNRKIIFAGILILALLQIQTTSVKDLALLDNDEQRVQSERSRVYPLTYIDFGFKVLWLKPVEWIEQNKIIIISSRIEKNLFKSIDINYYFFGGFPRNTPSDYEKFPFVLVPFFLAGTIRLLFKKKYFNFYLLFIVPIALLSLIGSDNPYGFFILFPFIIYSCLEGINYISSFFKKKEHFYVIFSTMVLLTLLMQIAYANI